MHSSAGTFHSASGCTLHKYKPYSPHTHSGVRLPSTGPVMQVRLQLWKSYWTIKLMYMQWLRWVGGVVLDGRVRGVHHVLYMLDTYVCVSTGFLFWYLSQFQQTALHRASEGGHHETVQLLLERGADPDRQVRMRGVYSSEGWARGLSFHC